MLAAFSARSLRVRLSNDIFEMCTSSLFFSEYYQRGTRTATRPRASEGIDRCTCDLTRESVEFAEADVRHDGCKARALTRRNRRGTFVFLRSARLVSRNERLGSNPELKLSEEINKELTFVCVCVCLS